MVIENSLIRNRNIEKLFEQDRRISKEDMKHLLSAPYPEGLCCHYYKEFFGTLRSMVFDVTDKTIEMTFGSPQVNTWQTFPSACWMPGKYRHCCLRKKQGRYSIIYFDRTIQGGRRL